MINKLALGTVQFGMSYGVANREGQVQIEEIKSILKCAKKNSINILDTAANYGSSEKVLGDVGINDFQVITKTIPLKNGVDEVIKGFYQSLDNLNIGQVHGLLIHSINDTKDKKFGALFYKLNELKKEGLVKKIGFSIYTPEQVGFLLENFNFDLIQIPINILDQRLYTDGWLEKLKNRNIEIHARSVFLQGLLLMKKELISTYFAPIENSLSEFYKLAKKLSLSQLELALGFVMQIDGIDRVLVGVNNVEQLNEILQAKRVYINPIDCIDISINDQSYTNPSLWKI